MPPIKDNANSDALNKNSTISTISKPKNIDEIVAKSAIKTLPTISVEPDYYSLN